MTSPISRSNHLNNSLRNNRSTKSRLAGLTLFLGILFTPLTVLAAIGELPGKFEVTPTGAASYSLPIVTPPGVNGVQPDISLNYSSRGGSSEIGIGWGLSGLSAITRCGASMDIDGFKGGVYFDDRDRFCFDGARLVPDTTAPV